MRRTKQYIAFFVLTFFILIKTVSLHAFTHFEEDEHNEDCNTCEFVITLNTTPFIENEQILFKESVQHNYSKKECYEYAYFFTKNYTNNTFFCRPPPAF